MRRDKTPLLLLEQLATLLVFALAAAVCLQLFVRARLQSQTIADRDRAALLCQNTAETLQAAGGGAQEVLTRISGVAPGYRSGFGYFARYDEGWEVLAEAGRTPRYTLRVLELDSGVSGLGKAEVEVYRWQSGEMESLFRLETAWQEGVDGNG